MPAVEFGQFGKKDGHPNEKLDPENVRYVEAWTKRAAYGTNFYLAPFVEEFTDIARSRLQGKTDWGFHNWMFHAHLADEPKLAERFSQLGRDSQLTQSSASLSTPGWYSRIMQAVNTDIFLSKPYKDTMNLDTPDKLINDLRSKEHFATGVNLFWSDRGKLREISVFSAVYMYELEATLPEAHFPQRLRPQVFLTSGDNYYKKYSKPFPWRKYDRPFVVPFENRVHRDDFSASRIRKHIRSSVGEAFRDAERSQTDPFTHQYDLPFSVEILRDVSSQRHEESIRKQLSSEWVLQESVVKTQVPDKQFFAETKGIEKDDDYIAGPDIWESEGDGESEQTETRIPDYMSEPLGDLPPWLKPAPAVMQAPDPFGEIMKRGADYSLSRRVERLRGELGSQADKLRFEPPSLFPDPLYDNDPLGLNESFKRGRLNEEIDNLRNSKGLPRDNSNSLSDKVDNLGRDLDLPGFNFGGFDY